MKVYLLIPALLIACLAVGQQPVEITVKNSTLAATDSILPFWLLANRDGKVPDEGSFLNLTDLFVGQPYASAPSGTRPGYTWGVNGVAAWGGRRYFQLNRAFAGITVKGLELKGGLFYEPEKHHGLSTSNGNIARSRNARPHPRLRFSTRGYRPLPFFENRLGIKATYEEGLLNDDRFVEGAHLHHKSLYLRLHPGKGWELEGGLEHFVMWGGTSRSAAVGMMPSELKSYLMYITGASGDESFPATDQLNVAGNQLGTYTLRVTKQFKETEAVFYLSHPFEDLSGMNWRNWPDNLLGLHLRRNNRQQLLTDVLIEYTNTRQQSIRGGWDRQEPDGYFNNGVYQSGFTYHHRMMGSPLFFPVIVTDGISRGLRSNLLVACHLGMQGILSRHLSWKGLLTWVQHEGLYFNRYNPVQRQLSALLELNFSNDRLPVDLGLSAAADDNSAIGRNLGVQFTISKTVGNRILQIRH